MNKAGMNPAVLVFLHESSTKSNWEVFGNEQETVLEHKWIVSSLHSE